METMENNECELSDKYFTDAENLSLEQFERFINNDTDLALKNLALKEYCIKNNYNYRKFARFSKDFYVKIVLEFLTNRDIAFTVTENLYIDIDKRVMLFVNPFNEFTQSKNYFERTLQYEGKGYRCIQLFEDHLLNPHKWNVLKDIIIHACGKTVKKIYARKLKVKFFEHSVDLKPFFEENNIQGYRNSKVAFALVDENDTVIMSYALGAAWLGKGKYDCEIARGACRLGYSVVGGASKLWKAILDYAKEKGFQSIVYYVDRNYYDGKSLGFLENTEFVQEMHGFWNYWTKDDKMKNREPTRHKEIVRKYKETNELLESGVNVENVRNADSLLQIWNIGTKTFVCYVK